MKIKALAAFAVALLTVVSAQAQSQTWSHVNFGGKNCFSNGDWIIEYTVDGALPNVYLSTVKQVGTNGFVDVASIRPCTGTNITRIACFKDKTALTGVTIPEELTILGPKCFQNTSISGDYVFHNPVDVGESALSQCPNITSVSFLAPGSKFGINVLYATKLRKADLRGIDNIPSGTLSENYALREVTISACVTNFGANAFKNCQGCNTMNVVLPEDLEAIPDVVGTVGAKAFNAFTLTNSFSTITIPFKGECTLDTEAFSNSKATNIVFWGKVPTSIGTSAFNLNSGVFAGGALGRITCSTNMDSRWVSQIRTAELTPADETATGFPGPSCFGKFTNSGKTFWLCHKESPYEAGACVHDWSDWVTNPAPTCVTTGLQIRECSKCHQTESVELPVLGHDWGNWTTNLEATCTADGQRRRECSRCHEVETDTISALGHQSGAWTTTLEPTCETAGSKSCHCSRCGQDATEVIPALGHLMGPETIVTEAKCLVPGLKSSVCTRQGCNHHEDAEIPALGHDWDDGVVVLEPDDTHEGILRKTCKRTGCGATEDESIPMLVGGVFVDCAVAVSGNGSSSSPYKTIKEGVAHVEAGGTVWVIGGNGRVYEFATIADVVTNRTANIAIRGRTETGRVASNYADTDKMAKVHIAETFADNMATTLKGVWAASGPFVILADNCTISGFDFEYSATAFSGGTARGGDHGCLFQYRNPGLTVENCRFAQTTDIPGNSGGMYSGVFGNDRANSATDLTIRRSSFFGENEKGHDGIIYYPRSGARIYECYFSNVCSIASPKQGGVGYYFVSNKVVNCSNRSPNGPSYGDHRGFFSRFENGCIGHLTCAYNCFVQTDGDPRDYVVLSFGETGALQADDFDIHHNTIIGYDCAFYTYRGATAANNADSWTPHIYNNLIMLRYDGAAIVEKTTLKTTATSNSDSGDATSLWTVDNTENYPSGYRPGSTWLNNAVYGTFNQVTVPVSGYDLDSCMEKTGSFVFSAELAPAAMSLDPASENFCRFKSSVAPALILAKRDWIGAVQPMMMGCGTHVIFY